MVDLKSIAVIGAGPAGLYVATLLKRRLPTARVRVIEQNAPDATFGFGVVFSDRALDFLAADDPETHALVTPAMERWQNMTLSHQGAQITLDGIGFAAIGRLDLLRLLQTRAMTAGVEIAFETRIEHLDQIDADLIIGADGLNSVVRAASPHAFGETLAFFSNRFAWFGTETPFETLTQTFLETPHGAVNAHHYRYTPAMSTFIVEAEPKAYEGLGFADMDEQQSAAACARLFADPLNGAALLTNRSHWRQFPKLWCQRWVSGNRVLIGDAAHTAHFSIGSGTRLAMEDAIALAASLHSHRDLYEALAAFEADRIPVAKAIVDAANTSAAWYDRFAEKMDLAPIEFAYDYVTRSGRVDLDRLRRIAPQFAAAYETYRSGIA